MGGRRREREREREREAYRQADRDRYIDREEEKRGIMDVCNITTIFNPNYILVIIF